MAWITPQYSKRKVDQAAPKLLTLDSIKEYKVAREIVNNWRSSHSYPLHVFKSTLQNRALNISENALVIGRIKRLFSICRKLSRVSPIKCTKMQDIAGCRAILPNVDNVWDLADLYVNGKRKFWHDLVRYDDYINNPKPDGYRGLHLVYKYQSRTKAAFNGMKVEIQIRSEDQHIWATAIETVDMFHRTAMKFGLGNKKWRRFFLLMSAVLSMFENTPPPEHELPKGKSLSKEICEIGDELNVRQTFEQYEAAVHRAITSTSGDNYFLLKFVRKYCRFQVLGFKDFISAAKAYEEAESSRNPNINAVLVAASDAKELVRAYPNYFIDTKQFLQLLTAIYDFEVNDFLS